MNLEIWTYLAQKPSNNSSIKPRPVLVIGDDACNNISIVDISYVLISSSAECGEYDVEINENLAKSMGLDRKSIIKTTKIFTGSKSYLGSKICDLPEEIKSEFIDKYKKYQDCLIKNMK